MGAGARSPPVRLFPQSSPLMTTTPTHHTTHHLAALPHLLLVLLARRAPRLALRLLQLQGPQPSQHGRRITLAAVVAAAAAAAAAFGRAGCWLPPRRWLLLLPALAAAPAAAVAITAAAAAAIALLSGRRGPLSGLRERGHRRPQEPSPPEGLHARQRVQRRLAEPPALPRLELGREAVPAGVVRLAALAQAAVEQREHVPRLGAAVRARAPPQARERGAVAVGRGRQRWRPAFRGRGQREPGSSPELIGRGGLPRGAAGKRKAREVLWRQAAQHLAATRAASLLGLSALDSRRSPARWAHLAHLKLE